MTTSILFGHGRKHRKLTSVDYYNSIFVDVDPKVDPDIIIDLKKETLNLPSNSFDEAVMVCSANMIVKREGMLNIDFLETVYNILKPGGKFYINNIYYGFPKYQLREEERDKLSRDIESIVNLKYVGEIPRLDVQRGQMMVFVKV